MATASAIARAKSLLDAQLGVSKVMSEQALCLAYAHDESEAPWALPDVVVHASNLSDIEATLAIALQTGVPVTPRAAGTGRSGGAIPCMGGIVLSTALLNNIKEIDSRNLLAVVQPGVITGDLHAAVEALGLFYPPDPNSWPSCMIGGNVAENAGGPRAFKYGTTRDYVLGIEACLMGGTTVRSGRRTAKGVTGYDITALLVGSEGTLGVFSVP
jgi:glycolate oxidase